MGVAGQRASHAHAVRAGLLLEDAPRGAVGILRFLQVLEQGGPLNAAFDGDQAPLLIEIEHAIESARVDEHTRLAELLATHRVPSARHAHTTTG